MCCSDARCYYYYFLFSSFKVQQQVFQERHDLGGNTGGSTMSPGPSLSGTKEPWGRGNNKETMELELGSYRKKNLSTKRIANH